MQKLEEKKKSKLILILEVLLISYLVVNQVSLQVGGGNQYLNLVYDIDLEKTANPSLGLYIAQYMRDLGIEVEVYTTWCCPPMYPSYIHEDNDLAALKLLFKNREPDFNFLKSIPFWNYFPTNYNFQFKDEFEEMIKLGPTIESEVERREYYYSLQEFYMDKILLYWPLFVENSYECLRSNTLGYDSTWGWIESLPYMSYEGLHEGQNSLQEFILADANWRELNPLFTDDSSSELIWKLLSEPLIKIDPEGNPTRYGLISNWIQINSSHFQFFMRPNVYWNPSYNVTERTANSEPLLNSTFMTGLKGEYSDGSNQIVTAKDAVFTLLSWANPLVSDHAYEFRWMKDIYVDPMNPLSFHILVDGNPETNETEYYSLIFEKLETSCLPEFFLNSTAETISSTSTGIECTGLYDEINLSPAWLTYSTSAFGCGKYMLDYAIDNSVTVLRKSPFWFGVGAIDGTLGMEPFVNTIKVRIIPDISAELAEFKAGLLDWIDTLASFRTEREQLDLNPLFDVYVGAKHYMNVLIFNIKGEGWRNLNNEYVYIPGFGNCTKGLAVRKAICHIIDRKELGDVLYEEDYSLSNSLLPPEMTGWYYENISTIYDYDLIKALTWMKNAGFDVTIPPELTGTPTITTLDYSIIFSAFGIFIFALSLIKKNKKIISVNERK